LWVFTKRKDERSLYVRFNQQKFGRLTCISFSHTEKGRSYWKCKCDCGSEKIIKGNDLTSGYINSCGCLRKELAKEKKFKDLTGKKFGLLTVLSLDEEKTNPPIYYWKCKCDCGNLHTVKAGDLGKNTKSCGCLLKTKSYNSLKIEKYLMEHNIIFKKEYTFSELCSLKGRPLRFDYAVFDKDNNLKFLIEYNGEQHYKAIPFFGGEEYYKTLCLHDQLKKDYCRNRSLPLYIFTYQQTLTQIYDALESILKHL